MAIFYLDTSALVKRYKTEDGSATVDRLYEDLPAGSNLATSFLSVLEFISALRRLLKANSISNDEFGDIVSTFSHEIEPFLIRTIDDKTVADAITYVVKHALRSADSMHLATVIELREIMKEIGENVIFICDDEELINAGRKENLDALNPRIKEDSLKLKEILERLARG